MARKVIIDCDPGIDDAVALILALFDPRLDVVAITTCSGTVESDRCTQNVLGLLERLDPPRIPRVGAGTDPEDAPVSDNRFLHGTDGVGNLGFSLMQRQHQVSSEKLIVETIKSDPDDVTILCLGPLTGVARAFQETRRSWSSSTKWWWLADLSIALGTLLQLLNSTCTLIPRARRLFSDHILRKR